MQSFTGSGFIHHIRFDSFVDLEALWSWETRVSDDEMVWVWPLWLNLIFSCYK
jgi:hypothetical protein